MAVLLTSGKCAAGPRRLLSRFFYFYPFRSPARYGRSRSCPGAMDRPGFAQFQCNVTLLDATLTRHLVSVASKGLTEMLSPLDATLMKKQGGGAWLWLTTYCFTSQSLLNPSPSN